MFLLRLLLKETILSEGTLGNVSLLGVSSFHSRDRSSPGRYIVTSARRGARRSDQAIDHPENRAPVITFPSATHAPTHRAHLHRNEEKQRASPGVTRAFLIWRHAVCAERRPKRSDKWLFAATEIARRLCESFRTASYEITHKRYPLIQSARIEIK